jgi:hypothetical protein
MRPVLLALLGLSLADSALAQPVELKHAHYTVQYQTGFEQDAKFAERWAEAAEGLMREKYGVTPDGYAILINLLPAPAGKVDVNTAVIHCCTRRADSVKTGTIEMLSPSAPAFIATKAVSSLGLPKSSEDYHAKILMSEYIPIGHYQAQASRPTGGWMYYSAPNWVVQGLQEYDAIFHTTELNRTVTAKRLTAWAVAHEEVFGCCSPSLAIGDDYNGGASFMTFLAQKFGEGVHARLLKSAAPTFDDALTEVTKPFSRAELFAELRRWLKEGAPLK